MGDIKYVIPHQPSIRILMKTAEILGVSFDSFLQIWIDMPTRQVGRFQYY